MLEEGFLVKGRRDRLKEMVFFYYAYYIVFFVYCYE